MFNLTDKSVEACEYVDIVGDDICDDLANTKACAYDFGDCCSFDKDRSLCIDCFCNLHLDIKQSYLQDSCSKESGEIEDVLIPYLLGNGKCELNFNHKEFDFDLGDCCIDNPKCSTPAKPLNSCKLFSYTLYFIALKIWF